MVRATAFTTVLAALVVACGSASDAATSPTPPQATSVTPTTPPVDDGAPSSTYPAFQPDMPKLVNHGGRVLAKPVAVTVAWDDNPDAATFEQLVDAIGATSYWRDVVGEYGVGPLTSGQANHVRLTKPLQVQADPNGDPLQPLMDLITTSLSDTTTSKWPAPTDQSVYILLVSGKTAETMCADGAGGMHESVKVNGKDVAFALVFECGGDPRMTALQGATISASHELAEAVTDPYPDVDGAWQGLDDDHLAWELFQSGQDENGDLCEMYEDSYGPGVSAELPQWVQRQWSNASALAGHAPCVTAAKEPYFNVTPLDTHDDLVADFGDFHPPFSPKSKGLKVAVGETRTVTLGLYSDAATQPFTVRAYEIDPFADPGKDENAPPPEPENLDLSLDRTSGQNGEKLHLSVKVKKSSGTGVHVVVVESQLGGASHIFPILVGGNPPDPTQRLGPDGIPGGKAWRFGRLRTPRLARAW